MFTPTALGRCLAAAQSLCWGTLEVCSPSQHVLCKLLKSERDREIRDERQLKMPMVAEEQQGCFLHLYLEHVKGYVTLKIKGS